MGTRHSKDYLGSGDVSSDDDFDQPFFMEPNYFKPNTLPPYAADDYQFSDAVKEDNSVDAIGGLGLFEPTISVDKLIEIESKLDLYEIISLMYLLCEDSKNALNNMMRALNAGRTSQWLLKWAKSEDMWQKKLVEALCIVQNYAVLKELGYNKNDLQHEFLPSQAAVTCSISKNRKLFYLISERLTKDQTLDFIQHMDQRTSKENSKFYDHDYLELYFLDWEISGVEYSTIQRVFKKMNLDWFYDQLDLILPSSTFTPPSPLRESKSKTMQDNANLATSSMDYPSSSSQGPRSSVPLSFYDSNRYDINPNKPGVILIINQESFYTEHEEQFKHLLHENKDEIQLADRQGTLVDRDRLESLFKRMNFSVIVEDNLTHLDMLKSIENVTSRVKDESSLVVCILSHGSNGVVYGANSCRVEVKSIEHIMCRRNKNLVGKPKLLILQACQGERCQKVIEEEDESVDDDSHNATDGLKKAPTADLTTYWATIPGYAAIRNAKTGSWFIQALCEEIEQSNSQIHVLDICTKINDNVSKKKWKVVNGENIMTPQVTTTFTKSFYLPSLKS
ncbi:caspase-8 [Anthonomus grandis grandis]|uniref:caspase-8 n=1 Tax=Anthonomus grandis grandis TaxID=2921223 RepID=UPI002165176D|nr:caspase-8 [Anthonomus grandis grandis]